MKIIVSTFIAISFLFTFSCGGGSEIFQDFNKLSTAVCACADTTCATTELQKLPALVAQYKGASATEENKNQILKAVRTMGDCAREKQVAPAVLEAASKSLNPSATPAANKAATP